MNLELCSRPKHLAVLLVLALAPAAATAAPAVGSPAPKVFSNSPALGAGIGALDFAGLVALDIPTESALDLGPRVTGEAMYNVMDLAPNLRLAVGGRMSFAYHSGDFDTSFWGLDFVPDAKIKFAVMDKLAVYGDLGMGLTYMHGSIDFRGDSDSTVSFTVQFGGGVSYALTPNVNLLGEVRFDFYTTAPFGLDTSHSIAVPTVGVQWHP
jgi:opacity protein-like surface antigen